MPYFKAQITGGLGVAFGVLTQLAAIGLILIMLGAIYKKIFVWHTGFWGEKASGWHYDLMLVLMNLVIAIPAGASMYCGIDGRAPMKLEIVQQRCRIK